MRKQLRAARIQAYISVIPFKEWSERLTLALMVGVSCTLIVLNQANPAGVTQFRASAMNMIAPLLQAVSAPTRTIQELRVLGGAWTQAVAENQILKRDNAQLLHWQQVAKRLQAENQQLRTMVRHVPEGSTSYISAQFVGDLQSPFSHSGLISAGRADGVKKDQAVISERGLVGRVVDVAESSARVLLMYDINARVPVLAEQSRLRAVMAGNGSAFPELRYLPGGAQLTDGELLVTSGDGGIFPVGLPVARVQLLEDGTVSVIPLVEPTQLETVMVVDYQL